MDAPNRDDAETAVHRLSRHLTCLRDAMLLSATGDMLIHINTSHPFGAPISSHTILRHAKLSLSVPPPCLSSPPPLSFPCPPSPPLSSSLCLSLLGDAVAAVLAPAATLAPRLLLRCLRQVFADFVAAAQTQMMMMTTTTTTMMTAHNDMAADITTMTIFPSGSGGNSGRDHRGGASGSGWKTFSGDGGGVGGGSLGGFLDRYDNPYTDRGYEVDRAASSSSLASSYSSKGQDFANTNCINYSSNSSNNYSSTSPGGGPLRASLSVPY